MIDIRIQGSDFDPAQQLARLDSMRVPAAASLLLFAQAENDVAELIVDHYPAMAKKELAAIAAEAAERWPLLATILIFRTGRLRPGDRSALVLVGAATSGVALEACGHLREQLAARAPFWQLQVPASDAGEQAFRKRRREARPPAA